MARVPSASAMERCRDDPIVQPKPGHNIWALASSIPVAARSLPSGPVTNRSSPHQPHGPEDSALASAWRLGLKMSRSCIAALTSFSSLILQVLRSSEGGAKLT